MPLDVIGMTNGCRSPHPNVRSRCRAIGCACRGWCQSGLRLCRPGPSRSISIEQRRRMFLGFLGSQSPQCPPSRGTPPDDPQPRIVHRNSVMQPPCSVAALVNNRSKICLRMGSKIDVVHPKHLGPFARCVGGIGGLVFRLPRYGGGARYGASVSTRMRSTGAAGKDIAQLLAFGEGRDTGHRQDRTPVQALRFGQFGQRMKSNASRRNRVRCWCSSARMRAMSSSAGTGVDDQRQTGALGTLDMHPQAIASAPSALSAV